MGATSGQSSADLIPDDSAPLPGPARAYHYFQALRLLEARFADSPKLGERGPAEQERIRLRPSTSLGFPASDIEDIRWIDGPGATGRRAEVTAGFLGLYGATSPLPRWYAQQVLWDEDTQPQVRAFLDIFHHRLLSLLYRTWKRHRYEHAFEEGGKDRLSQALLHMIGVNSFSDAAALGIEPVRLLRYVGLFLLRSRPLAGLLTLLREELALPISIEQFPLRQVRLRETQGCKLGVGCLGRDVVIGLDRPDRMGQLAVTVGPVSYAEFLRLLPGGPNYQRLVALTRLYVRQPLDLLLQVLVPAAEVEGMRVGGDAPSRLDPAAILGTPRQDPARFVIEISP